VRGKKIRAVVTAVLPRTKVQFGNLNCAVLLDSGSARSIILYQNFQQLNRGGEDFKLLDTDVTCVTASEHNLEVVGEVKMTLKVNQFSWTWHFLVGKRFKGQPILGADFISRSNLIVDLGQSRCYFRFAPEVHISFCKNNKPSSGVCYIRLNNRSPPIQCGKLSLRQRKELETLIQHYPDVLTPELALTKVLEYDIQLLDKTPVRLAPYRLSPPKMQYLRAHLKQLLEDGVIEPSNSHYSSPMFLVPKGEGNYRAVVDFRSLNKRIAIESVP